ncbi:kinase-like domain-containing protein [Gigaspora rosea]|uniref:Kinase-like domain-containing protein n=1 Tax=Gigaspora rosea TaxID=44941 RepID=A0A397VPH6_9GLOM|nr:kinase-like domain-containing protein [Gigaspora rosea]
MDSEQLRTLGYNYELGNGVKKDEKKAFEYYMKAAELENSDAMNDVSLCYKQGIGVVRNYQKSFEYCKRSADLGNARGMCSVGKRYKYGEGVDQDYNKAFEYYKKSANMGLKSAIKYKSLLKTNKSPDHINPELKRILDDERFKLSWIDYNEFRDIREKGKGGFATVYSASWFDRINSSWKGAALKVIHNSNENEQEFIQELKNYCEIGYENPSFLNCHGVSRNYDGDYIIVMGIAPKGSLRQNLVESIHAQELVHRDLHSGNILQRDELQQACITDLGLSKNEKEGKICGILPYIAPEVLVGQPYTKASDIYGLGVIMTEISTGQRSFDGIPFDEYLVLRIIDGTRPKCLGPDCYIKLATKCMDKDFDKRPTATEIIEMITRWLGEIDQEGDNEIKNQILE